MNWAVFWIKRIEPFIKYERWHSVLNAWVVGYRHIAFISPFQNDWNSQLTSYQDRPEISMELGEEILRGDLMVAFARLERMIGTLPLTRLIQKEGKMRIEALVTVLFYLGEDGVESERCRGVFSEYLLTLDWLKLYDYLLDLKPEDLHPKPWGELCLIVKTGSVSGIGYPRNPMPWEPNERPAGA